MMLDNEIEYNIASIGDSGLTKIGTMFSGLLKLVPRFKFDKAVDHHNADHYTKSFTSWRQFITLMYAQIKGKDSLRYIETGLAAQSSRWHHLGLSRVRRSTLSDANDSRDYVWGASQIVTGGDPESVCQNRRFQI